jgi:hypothetical protein
MANVYVVFEKHGKYDTDVMYEGKWQDCLHYAGKSENECYVCNKDLVELLYDGLIECHEIPILFTNKAWRNS